MQAHTFVTPTIASPSPIQTTLFFGHKVSSWQICPTMADSCSSVSSSEMDSGDSEWEGSSLEWLRLPPAACPRRPMRHSTGDSGTNQNDDQSLTTAASSSSPSSPSHNAHGDDDDDTEDRSPSSTSSSRSNSTTTTDSSKSSSTSDSRSSLSSSTSDSHSSSDTSSGDEQTVNHGETHQHNGHDSDTSSDRTPTQRPHHEIPELLKPCGGCEHGEDFFRRSNLQFGRQGRPESHFTMDGQEALGVFWCVQFSVFDT